MLGREFERVHFHLPIRESRGGFCKQKIKKSKKKKNQTFKTRLSVCMYDQRSSQFFSIMWVYHADTADLPNGGQ